MMALLMHCSSALGLPTCENSGCGAQVSNWALEPLWSGKPSSGPATSYQPTLLLPMLNMSRKCAGEGNYADQVDRLGDVLIILVSGSSSESKLSGHTSLLVRGGPLLSVAVQFTMSPNCAIHLPPAAYIILCTAICVIEPLVLQYM